VKRSLAAIVFILIGMSAFAYGAQPIDALKGPMDQIIAILNEPQYQDAAKKGLQRDKMWEIIQTVFDFGEISKRTVAGYWKRFSAEQQNEFTNVFSEFLGNTYLNKIQGQYANEKVLYLGQEMLTDSRALIKTRILRENSIEIPVNYRMQRRNNAWKIYDVNIEGVSLVKNYRSQFKQILLKQTPVRLITLLKKKLERQKKN